jgi:hypothetical protein
MSKLKTFQLILELLIIVNIVQIIVCYWLLPNPDDLFKLGVSIVTSYFLIRKIQRYYNLVNYFTDTKNKY